MLETEIEVTFKYYLPTHKDDLWIHFNAQKMYNLLWELDQKCRDVLKYEMGSEDKQKFAQRLRELINEEINFNQIC